MKIRTITPQAAADMQARVRASPLLNLREGDETSYSVARVGYIPSGSHRELLHPGLGGDTSGATPYFETTDAEVYRLPDELARWAIDLVALAFSGAKMFPAPIKFGITSGRYWAEIA